MILVTGGTGFLGRHLVPGLSHAGFSLRVLTRDPARHPWLAAFSNVEVIQGDVTNAELIHQAMIGCRYVIHAAGLFSLWGDEKDFFQTNVKGTENVVRTAAAERIERLIYVSTAAIMGDHPGDDIIDENYPPHPADPYQRSKLEAEQAVLRCFEDTGMPCIVLRPGAFYGPYGDYAFNRLFFRDPMRGIIMQPDGGRYITFPIYIGDVVKGIILALEKGKPGEIYNLSGDWISHREAFDIVVEEARLRWPRIMLPGRIAILFSRFLTLLATITRREPFYPINLRSLVFNNWRVSSEKARRELGFQTLDFREGARRTIAWYKAGRPDNWPID